MGCFGVEVGNPDIAVTSFISIPCNDNQGNAKNAKTLTIAEAGLEPNPVSAVNCSTKRQSAESAVGKTVGNSEFPPDLRKVIDHWDTLPAEVKQTILTLVKHSRKRKSEPVLS